MTSYDPLDSSTLGACTYCGCVVPESHQAVHFKAHITDAATMVTAKDLHLLTMGEMTLEEYRASANKPLLTRREG